MAAYRRVYDSRHLQADYKNRDRLRDRTLGNRVWATFTFFYLPSPSPASALSTFPSTLLFSSPPNFGNPRPIVYTSMSTRYRPGGGETICPTPADGSSTRGGSTSVCGRVRSPHISGGRPAAGSQRAYSLNWDRQTDGLPDGSQYRLMPAPYRAWDNNQSFFVTVRAGTAYRKI